MAWKKIPPLVCFVMSKRSNICWNVVLLRKSQRGSFSPAAEELAGGGNEANEGIFALSSCNTAVEKLSDLLMHFNYC